MNILREHIMETYIAVCVFEVPSKRQILEVSLLLSVLWQPACWRIFFDKCSQKIKMSHELLACLGNWLWNLLHRGGSRKKKGGNFFHLLFLMSNMSDLIEHPFIFEQTLEWMKWPFTHEERWTLTQPVKNVSVAFFRILRHCFDTIVFKLHRRSKHSPVWTHWKSVFVVTGSCSVLLCLWMSFELAPLRALTLTMLLISIERANWVFSFNTLYPKSYWVPHREVFLLHLSGLRDKPIPDRQDKPGSQYLTHYCVILHLVMRYGFPHEQSAFAVVFFIQLDLLLKSNVIESIVYFMCLFLITE